MALRPFGALSQTSSVKRPHCPEWGSAVSVASSEHSPEALFSFGHQWAFIWRLDATTISSFSFSFLCPNLTFVFRCLKCQPSCAVSLGCTIRQLLTLHPCPYALVHKLSNRRIIFARLLYWPLSSFVCSTLLQLSPPLDNNCCSTRQNVLRRLTMCTASADRYNSSYCDQLQRLLIFILLLMP